MTHELRTPLTTLRMYTEMLSENMVTDGAARRDYLGRLHAEAVRLSHLVENVLAYARIERGRARGQIETVTVEALLARTAERARQRAEDAGFELTLPPPDVLPDGGITTDAAVVEQIVFNLVDNACKYAATAADRHVHLEVEGKRRHVMLRVRDHGPGVAAGQRRHLFKPFRKSAQAAADSARGVGLGLSLCRRLARSLGGRLCLNTAIRDGAAFDLWLPR